MWFAFIGLFVKVFCLLIPVYMAIVCSTPSSGRIYQPIYFIFLVSTRFILLY